MNPEFSIDEPLQGMMLLRSSVSLPVPVNCGFGGVGLLDGPVELDQARASLQRLFPGHDVILPRQTHGDVIITELSGGKESEGDALFFSVVEARRPLVAAIRTADCVPLLVFSPTEAALIHAGWRGLANGIIQKTLNLFSSGQRLTVLIGPCAGVECYEVGAEVVSAIGESAVYTARGDSLWLDTAMTAQRLAHEARGEVVVTQSGICTICDRRFHSFRRDRDRSGRNISFVAIS